MGLINAAKRRCGVCRKVLGPSTLSLDTRSRGSGGLDAGINLSHGKFRPWAIGDPGRTRGSWHTMYARCSSGGLPLAVHGTSWKGRECQQMAIESFCVKSQLSLARLSLSMTQRQYFVSLWFKAIVLSVLDSDILMQCQNKPDLDAWAGRFYLLSCCQA
jgi:hypothetical protein